MASFNIILVRFTLGSNDNNKSPRQFYIKVLTGHLYNQRIVMTLQHPIYGLCVCGVELRSPHVQYCGDCFGKLAYIWNNNKILRGKIFRDPALPVKRFKRRRVDRTCQECRHTTWLNGFKNCYCLCHILHTGLT